MIDQCAVSMFNMLSNMGLRDSLVRHTAFHPPSISYTLRALKYEDPMVSPNQSDSLRISPLGSLGLPISPYKPLTDQSRTVTNGPLSIEVAPSCSNYNYGIPNQQKLLNKCKCILLPSF